MLVYVLAYIVRPWVTDDINRKYFFPALTVRVMAAIAVGLLYQFYYEGGDTFNYHTYGSRYIWNAFMEDSHKGLKLLFISGHDYKGVYQYASKIVFIGDPASLAVVKLAALVDLLTFSTYSATAVVFAVFAFAGAWLLFITFYRIHPSRSRLVALVTLFVPSVVFWGSGLLKDTITLSCVCIATYAIYRVFIQRQFSITMLAVLLVVLYGLFLIKIYILLTYLPAAIIWVFAHSYSHIRPVILKLLLFPFVAVVALSSAYYSIIKAGEDNPKYSLDAIARTAQVTAYDIRYWTGRDAGSGYALGELDGSWQSMLSLCPQAINVSLFRPYLWEVRNPLMFLSAVESLALLVLTLYIFAKSRLNMFRAMLDPHVIFCLVFSLSFAFAVGVSTFNFGTLARYKIPLLPFFLLGLILLLDYPKRERNERVLDFTE